MAKIVKKNKPASKKTLAKKTTAKKPAAKTKSASAKKKVSTKAKVVKKTTSKSGASTKSKTPVKAKISTRKSASTTKSGRTIEVISTSSRKAKVAKKIKGYSKKDLKEFKKVILAKREEIIEQLQNLKDQMMDSTTGQYVNENSPYSLHMAEQGTDAQEREKLYLWAQRETKFLGYLEDALQRIDNGTYGICIDSLELKAGPHLVPKNRLLAVPHTQHCVECKNKKKI